MRSIGRIALYLGLTALPALATIVGTQHDLGTGYGGDNDEVCVYCHTPHSSNQGYDFVPLWNKPLTTTQFTMYGATAPGTPGQTLAGTQTDPAPTGPSMACLSCHDGVSAMNSVVNAPGSGGYSSDGVYIGNNNRLPKTMPAVEIIAVGLGGDLTNDHPISIPYIEGRAGLKPLNTPVTGWNNADTIADLLRDGKVQCVSCHDPHDPQWGRFLRHTNTGSQLCLTCHDK